MSRTHAHVPEAVQLARVSSPTLLVDHHAHWVAGPGRVGCLDERAGCHQAIARWASTQRWSRRGTCRVERTSVVRDQLKAAARTYNTTGQVDDPNLPSPVLWCLCQACGMND